MFSVFPKNEGGFDKIILQSDTSSVEIIPNCGGILNAWHVKTKAGLLNLIEGYESEADFRENCESKVSAVPSLAPLYAAWPRANTILTTPVFR